jgi:hypothetical protein
MQMSCAKGCLPDLQSLNDLALERGTKALDGFDAILPGGCLTGPGGTAFGLHPLGWTGRGPANRLRAFEEKVHG